VITPEFGNTKVRSQVELTLGGRPIVWEDSVASKEFSLVGTVDTGWIDRSTLVSLHALAEVPNATYELNYEGTVSTVRFRNEEPYCINAFPIIPRPNPDSTDWYNQVEIRLMEV
jgi:hypothetical protein